jgi:hypothetical protein
MTASFQIRPFHLSMVTPSTLVPLTFIGVKETTQEVLEGKGDYAQQEIE